MIYALSGGGGISTTKSIIGVTIDTGSIVGLYSNSAMTTLVKAGKEMSAGMYVISDVGNGTYWIKATKNGQTASKQIVISSAGVYTVKLNYGLWLYDNGDEFIDITSGWTNDRGTIVNNTETGELTLSWNTSSNIASFHPVNKFELSDYHYIKIVAKTSYRSQSRVGINTTVYRPDYTIVLPAEYPDEPISIPISPTRETLYYVLFSFGYSGTATIKQMWLEP